jgi:hypothetical protein
MKTGITFFLLIILTRGYAHAPLGEGIIEIDFNDKTVIENRDF